MTSTKKCCIRNLNRVAAHLEAHAEDGDIWTCPVCRGIWNYVEDEAESGGWTDGGFWVFTTLKNTLPRKPRAGCRQKRS